MPPLIDALQNLEETRSLAIKQLFNQFKKELPALARGYDVGRLQAFSQNSLDSRSEHERYNCCD
jgi:hypothetical protein